MAATRFRASRCRFSTLLVAILVVGLTAANSAAKPTATKARDTISPTPPGELALQGATPTTLTVTWEASRDNRAVAVYEVAARGSRVGSTRDRRFTITGLVCGQSYPVAVVAVDRSGNRSKPSIATASTAACFDTAAPTAPTAFRQDFTTASSVVVSWTPSTDDVGVVGYGILDAGVRVATTPESRFTFDGLTCGATRSYGVEAVDAAGNRSAASTVVVQAASCADTTAPTSPSPVSVVDASASTVSIAWPKSSDNVGVDHYNVYRGAVKVAEASATSSTVGGLTCGTSYTLGVDAEDLAGNASSVAGVVAATRACSVSGGGDTQPPAAPSALAVTSATETSLAISWTKSTDNVGVTQYTIYLDGAAKGVTSSSAYTLQDLSCGKTYTVAVDASDAAGNRSQKAQVYLSSAACADGVAPSSPASVTAASRSQTSISLLWSPSSDNVGVAGYGVYRSGARVAQTGGTGFTVTGLTCGTDYSLGVDAYDGSGNRSSISTVRIGTLACGDTTPPTAPANLAVSSVAASSLALGWAASTDDVGVAGYDVFRNGVKVVSVTALSSLQSSLSCGTAYQFAVVAFDAAGNRSTQSSVTASTSSCPGGTTITSSVNNGDTVAQGAAWAVTAEPTASRVEFWADGSKIADDTTAPFETIVNLPAGSHSLGLCPWVGGVRQCQSTVSSGVFAVVSVASASPALPQNGSGANIWVDGNGGTCQRSATAAAYGDAAACGSLVAAHAAASAGDVVRIKSGSYGDAILTADKGSPAVQFKPAEGESPSFGTITVATGSGWVTFDGLAMDSYAVGPTITGPGGTPPPAAHDVRFVNVDANTFLVNRAERVAISGGDYGPAHSRKPTIAVSNPWDTYAPTDVTVENARFHDITMDVGGEHVECILVYAGAGVTIRGNTFSNCEGTGDVAVMYLRVPGYQPSLANVSVVGNTFSSEGNAANDPTAAWFNVQADRCVPGLEIQDNVAPKGIYYTPDC